MTADREKLAQQLLTAYVEELETHVAALNEELLALEREGVSGATEERLHALFRTVHTIKGSSRAAGAGLVEQVTHHLEDVLARLREQRLAFSPSLFELLFGVTDAIAETGERLRRGDLETGGTLAAFLPKLAAAVAEAPGYVPPVASLATPRADNAGASAQGPSMRISPERVDELIARTSELSTSQARLRARYAELETLYQSLTTSMRAGQSASQGSSPGDRPADARRDGPSRRRSRKDGRRGQDARVLATLERILAASREDQRRLGADVEAVDLAARRLRMVPFAEACLGLDRAVRDLAASSGKLVSLVIEGGDLSVDRAVLDGLRPSLVHLARNAIDHGLEDEATRVAAGKPPVGLLRVSARHRGSEIAVSVEDDGRGVDVSAVRAQLQKKGLPVPVRDEDVLRAIFQAGFSTARLITDLSGRGVGLDVVRRGIEALRGTIDVGSVPGRSTQFTLAVPLTLTSLRGLLVRAAAHVFVVPGTAVVRLVRVAPEDSLRVGGVSSVLVSGVAAAVVTLAEVLGLPSRPSASGKLPAILVTATGGRLLVVVDEIIEERDVFVQSLGPRLRGSRGATGATVLPDGGLALVLDVAEVVARARGLGSSAAATTPTGSGEIEHRRILLVDDSLTTRTLERSILEAAGYLVRTAGDGEEALRLLHEHGADLVVSDVEMPHMDGFTLTETLRATPRFQQLPVVLLTALGTEADKARGLSVGADAYLVKSSFDQQNLLETIAQLL